MSPPKREDAGFPPLGGSQTNAEKLGEEQLTAVLIHLQIRESEAELNCPDPRLKEKKNFGGHVLLLVTCCEAVPCQVKETKKAEG